jgi:arylformamidase
MTASPTNATLAPEQLDAQYNNRALVPQFQRHFDHWQKASKAAQKRMHRMHRTHLDLPYGQHPLETLDVFAPRDAHNAPVLVFIHGGYWRSMDKADHRFLAEPWVNEGAVVVLINYPLCPGDATHGPVTVATIANACVKALAWVHANIAVHGGDPHRVSLAGHSAGGHLAAMLLCCNWSAVDARIPKHWITSAVSVSGLYDLRVIANVPFLKDSVRLNATDALKCSPALFSPPRHAQLASVVGADESAEFLRHNEMIQTRWGQAVVPTCETIAHRNHFSVIEDMAQAGTRLHSLVHQQIWNS